MIRTVGAYEAAGVAGIHLEDQVAPKKCGHMEGKQVIPADEMAAKIRAAVDARRRSDFMIIARTDARAVEGLERAIERARAYRAAGADALFVEAVLTETEAAEVGRAFPDVPLLFNWAEGGKTPPVSLARLTEIGYRIVIFPIGTLLAATAAMRRNPAGNRPGRHAPPQPCPDCPVSGISGFHRAARGTRGRAAVRRQRPPAPPATSPRPTGKPAWTRAPRAGAGYARQAHPRPAAAGQPARRMPGPARPGRTGGGRA